MNDKKLKITIEQRIALAEAMREMGLFLASKHVDLFCVNYEPYQKTLYLRMEFYDNILTKGFFRELFWLFVYNKINSGTTPLPSLNEIDSCLVVEDWPDEQSTLILLKINTETVDEIVERRD